MSERVPPSPRLRRLAVLALCILVIGAAGECLAQSECLVQLKRSGGAVDDASTLCAVAQEEGVCTFQLQLCLNQADGSCAPVPMKKKVKAKGSCRRAAKLLAKPDASNPVCGSSVDITVKTKKKGRREGKCKISIAAKASEKPKRRDVDKLTLVCKPTPGTCPEQSSVTTTTTIPPACLLPCDCCVRPVTDLALCIAP